MKPAARRLGAATPVLWGAVGSKSPATAQTPYSWLNESQAETSKQGALRGRRIAIKENIALEGAPTSCSSSILKDYTSPFTATCVGLLEDAGASICGQTKMDEFGMGSLTSHIPRYYGPVHNPSSPDRSKEPRYAGGSSGGSAAAVADGSCWAALGTDTGGSVRLPASYCGIVGLKPSYGMISRYGVVSYADSLDCVGVLAKEVGAAQAVFDIASRSDERDMTCVSAAARSKARKSTQAQLAQLPGHSKSTLEGLRIGVPSQTLLPEPHLALPEALLAFLQEKGASLFSVDLPSFSSALPAYYVLASAEASSNLARYGGGFFGPEIMSQILESGEERRRRLRTEGFGNEVKKRLLAGTHALSANAFNNTYLKALHLRRQLRREFDRTFRLAHPLRSTATRHDDGVDVLLHPTAIRTAPRVDEDTANGGNEYVQDVLTVPASLGGLPAMSVPAGRGPDGWPVGVSLTGQWGSEELLFWLGRAVEQWQLDT